MFDDEGEVFEVIDEMDQLTDKLDDESIKIILGIKTGWNQNVFHYFPLFFIKNIKILGAL